MNNMYIEFLEHWSEEDLSKPFNTQWFHFSIVLKCENGQWRKGMVVSGEFDSCKGINWMEECTTRGTFPGIMDFKFRVLPFP
jgi:hypothetical protein